jgi:glucan phosphoethanolaminetransferase (alkaline phosphatase superfamily)
VLALHAMACLAGFIAGSSLPLQAERRTGLSRTIHERGRPVAIALVVCATGASLSLQAYVLGHGVAAVAATLQSSPELLLVSLLPHALPELVALFLPLAAWMAASRRGAWDHLLAATFVTVALAVPVLVVSAVWEVYAAPHVVWAVFGHHY